MEITLEKIELVKDRTGVSYSEAKEALEEADGSVVDAIINIEETIDHQEAKSFSKQGTAVIESLKDLIKKGNVAKILVKRDEEVVLQVPVNAGILGAIIAPWGVVVGVVAAFGFKCTIEVIKDDGTVIDVSDSVSDTMGTVVEKGSVVADEVKEKSADIYQNAKVKATEAINKVKKDRPEDIDFSSCFSEDMDDMVEDTVDSVEEKVEEVKDKIDE
ncbi:MAG: DUF4342 domain-containing protein [Anaerovoracaceae bacterium]